MSTAAIFKIAHKVKFDRLTTIYILPTRDDVHEFVPTKVDPILESNGLITPGKNSSKERKTLGDGDRRSHWLFKGSFKEHEAIMIDADLLVFDEVDKCDQNVLQTYESRIQASELGHIWRFSTPTVPNEAIDRHFERSDQKHYFINCPTCDEMQYLEWPGSVCYDRRIYACKKCSAEITDNARRKGIWVAKYPTRDVSGYWVSQMLAPWIPAYSLINEEETKEKSYFNNFCLGLAYAGSDITVSKAVIISRLSNERNSMANLCMGIDQGSKRHHYIVGNNEGIVEIGIAEFTADDNEKGFNLLDLKMREYDIRTAVIDGLPYTDKARALASTFPYRVFLNFYTNRPKDSEMVEYKDEDFLVVSDRQRTLDATIRAFYEGDITFTGISQNTLNFDTYILQWGNVFLKTETDRYGQERQVWDAVQGNDHFAHATNYWRIAVERNEMLAPVGKTKVVEENERALILKRQLEGIGKGKRGGDWYND
jgi:RNase H-fold protein (predicted Holliday junction resolvase)